MMLSSAANRQYEEDLSGAYSMPPFLTISQHVRATAMQFWRYPPAFLGSEDQNAIRSHGATIAWCHARESPARVLEDPWREPDPAMFQRTRAA